jgi:hypothetical protein
VLLEVVVEAYQVVHGIDEGTCSPSRNPDRSGAGSGVKVNVLGHK